MTREQRALKIRQALAKICSRTPGKDINELRAIVAIERAIARMESLPEFAEHLIFKGGFVLLKTTETHRYTRDLDASAQGLSKETLPLLIETALRKDLDDGLWYGQIHVADLVVGQYGGLRFTAPFQIGDPPRSGDKKLSRITIDIGIGDLVHSDLVPTIMSSIIGAQPVTWLIYPPEYIFSEKLEALFSRGESSSRAKDIYDLGLLFPKCSDSVKLREAIQKTFNNRGTKLPVSFFEEGKQIKLTSLEPAWNSVVISGEKPSFEQVWELMLSCLKELDKRWAEAH